MVCIDPGSIQRFGPGTYTPSYSPASRIDLCLSGRMAIASPTVMGHAVEHSSSIERFSRLFSNSERLLRPIERRSCFRIVVDMQDIARLEGTGCSWRKNAEMHGLGWEVWMEDATSAMRKVLISSRGLAERVLVEVISIIHQCDQSF